MQNIRLLVVDDCGMIREIIVLLVAAEPQIHCVAQAETGSDAFHYLSRNSVDVVTLDLELPDMNGIAMIGAIKDMARCGVVVVSGNSDCYPMALAAGASACFSKSDLMSNRAAFINAIRMASKGPQPDLSGARNWRKSA